MSDTISSVPLGELSPARSRQAGRRSAVSMTDGLVVAGLASGEVAAFDRQSIDEQWRASPDDDAAIVSAEPVASGIAVGERSATGTVRYYDIGGTLRWSFDTAEDLGPPTKESRFFLPFVADIASAGDRLYVAARRYERDADSRSFVSVVYAFDPDGSVRWTYETDASPISLDADDDRLAVAYNRCPGEFQHGLAVLDGTTGEERYLWDPGTDGQRRVGDVSLVEDGIVLTSHGDYCGYRLAEDGAERFRVELATPVERDGETLYAYPNHVHATASGIVFVTGNTYAVESRETESLHPNEHTVFGLSADGEKRWSEAIGGFAHGIDAAGDRIAIPSAQQFRTRNPDVHGLSVFDVTTGRVATGDGRGVITAAALDGDDVVAIEEPVSYHDQETVHGAYRLHAGLAE